MVLAAVKLWSYRQLQTAVQPVLLPWHWCLCCWELNHLSHHSLLCGHPSPMHRARVRLGQSRSLKLQMPAYSPSQPFMQVSVDTSMASDKWRLRPTFKTQPILLFMWFLLTQRGALGGAPELSGGGKPQPTWCHSLGPVSCLRGQERQSPAQFTSRYPTLSSSKNDGETVHLRHGWYRQAHGINTRLPRLHMLQLVNKPGLHLLLQKHSGGSSCSSALSISMALKCCKRFCARQAALLQVHCVPYGDAETAPELGSDKQPWLLNNTTKSHRATRGCVRARQGN